MGQYFLQILTLPFSRLEAFKHPLYILGGLPSSKLAHLRQHTWPQLLTLTEGTAGRWPRIYSQSLRLLANLSLTYSLLLWSPVAPWARRRGLQIRGCPMSLS